MRRGSALQDWGGLLLLPGAIDVPSDVHARGDTRRLDRIRLLAVGRFPASASLLVTDVVELPAAGHDAS